MSIDKNIKNQIKKIDTALLDFDGFPLSNQVSFLKACMIANAREPITPAIQVVIDRSAIPFGNLIAAYSGNNIDISGGSSMVEAFNEVRKGVPARIDLIKTMVKGLMPNNKVVLIALKLDKVTRYRRMSQADLFTTVQEMFTTAKTYSALTTVLPLITSLVNDVDNPLTSKQEQFININSDRKKMIKLVEAAQNCLIANYGSFLTMFFDKLENIIEYFPIILLYNKVHAPGYLTKKQDLVESPLTPIVHISKLKVTNSCWVKIENFDSRPMRVWRSINVSTTIPEDAPTVGANSVETFYAGDMGVDDAYCLMAGFTLPLDTAKAKFSIRNKR